MRCLDLALTSVLLVATAGVSSCSKPSPSAEVNAPAAATAADQSASSPPASPAAPSEPQLTTDHLPAEGGNIDITPLQHATLSLVYGDTTIFIDPWSQAPLPAGAEADLVLVTDVHGDHFDAAAIRRVSSPETVVVAPPAVAKDLPGAIRLENGQTQTFAGISVEAVPMYNLKRGPEPGKLFHDRGRGNGYLLSLGGKRVYISGDSECTSEMRALKNVDVAFVCMNLPYTMPPEEAAECVKAFHPKIVYPYHYRGSDLSVFQQALSSETGIEVRLREWYPSTPAPAKGG